MERRLAGMGKGLLVGGGSGGGRESQLNTRIGASGKGWSRERGWRIGAGKNFVKLFFVFQHSSALIILSSSLRPVQNYNSTLLQITDMINLPTIW